MDFGLTEEQEMLRRMARGFLEENCPKTFVRDMEKSELGYSPELWSKMAELGWMGIAFPAEYGGTDGDFLNLAILLEEMGQALLPGPFVSTVVLCGFPILEFGTAEQKEEFLPGIIKGKIIMTLALTEPSARYDASGVEVQAVPEGDDYLISGTKLFVPDAHIAQYFLCVARTKPGKGEDGITLFLVDSQSPGISCTMLKTVGADKQGELILDKVRVPRGNILGKLDRGWEVIRRLRQQAAMAYCALMVGGAQQVLEMTVDYAKDRVQFGHPIGALQIIQHKCSDIAIDVDGARFIAYEAAWKLSEGMPCELEVSMAKSRVGEAYRRICLESHQVHGGIGVTWDHDLQLYHRRAKLGEVAFGDATFHKELVAQQLGL